MRGLKTRVPKRKPGRKYAMFLNNINSQLQPFSFYAYGHNELQLQFIDSMHFEEDCSRETAVVSKSSRFPGFKSTVFD